MLRWPDGHVFSGEPLKLCFVEGGEAKAWRDALVTAVRFIPNSGFPNLGPSREWAKATGHKLFLLCTHRHCLGLPVPAKARGSSAHF